MGAVQTAMARPPLKRVCGVGDEDAPADCSLRRHNLRTMAAYYGVPDILCECADPVAIANAGVFHWPVTVLYVPAGTSYGPELQDLSAASAFDAFLQDPRQFWKGCGRAIRQCGPLWLYSARSGIAVLACGQTNESLRLADPSFRTPKGRTNLQMSKQRFCAQPWQLFCSAARLKNRTHRRDVDRLFGAKATKMKGV
jgi:hypothetical protein